EHAPCRVRSAASAPVASRPRVARSDRPHRSCVHDVNALCSSGDSDTMRRLLLSLSLLLAACADDPSGSDDLLAPPPAGRGGQFARAHESAPGGEGGGCRFGRAADSGLWGERDGVRFTAGSHHFLLYETAYDAIPTANDRGEPVDTSGVFDCSTGATDG